MKLTSPTPMGILILRTPSIQESRINRRSLRIATLLALIAALNMLDLVYTLFANRQGMLSELNPIAANLFKMDLEPSVICFKLLTMITAFSLLWRLRKNPWVTIACWFLVFIYVALGFRWFLWSQDYSQIMELTAKNAALPLHLARAF